MSSKRKLKLHIGPHKTGTTALQTVLGVNRQLLLSHQFQYVDRFDGNLAAHDLADLISTGSFQRVTQAMHGLLLSGDDIVISSENFCRLNEAQIAFLCEALVNLDVEIIYYCRSPLERLPSAWQEWIKHGYVHTFPEYLAARLLRFMVDPEINDASRLTQWRTGFPSAKLSIHNYDHISDLPQHFFEHHMPFSIDTAQKVVRENSSLSIERIEAIRASQGMHKVIDMYPETSDDLAVTLNEIVLRIISHTTKGDFVKRISARLSDPPFQIIEKQLIGAFPEVAVRTGQVFGVREKNWAYVDTNIWIYDKELSLLMANFKEVASNRYPKPAMDLRLLHV